MKNNKVHVLLTLLIGAVCCILGAVNGTNDIGFKPPMLDVRWSKDTATQKWFCAVILPENVEIHTIDVNHKVIFLYVPDPNTVQPTDPNSLPPVQIPVGYKSGTGKIHRKTCQHYKDGYSPVYTITDPNDACKVCRPE